MAGAARALSLRLPPSPDRRIQRRFPSEEPPRPSRSNRSGYRGQTRFRSLAAGVLRGIRRAKIETRDYQSHGRVSGARAELPAAVTRLHTSMNCGIIVALLLSAAVASAAE